MKILGYTYQVTTADVDSIGAFGRCRPKEMVIQIAADLCDEQKLSTLLHEMIEAINCHLQLDLEHAQIMGLEAGLYQTLSDNGADLTPLLGLLNEEL